jgi:hypothetical protein
MQQRTLAESWDLEPPQELAFGKFTYDAAPEDRTKCRVWLPSTSTYGNDLYLHSGKPRREWQATLQERVVDEVGYYKLDHGFKNNNKFTSVPGCKASLGTCTVMTSTMKIAGQVDVHSTSVEAIAPTLQRINSRCNKMKAPVRTHLNPLPRYTRSVLGLTYISHVHTTLIMISFLHLHVSLWYVTCLRSPLCIPSQQVVLKCPQNGNRAVKKS